MDQTAKHGPEARELLTVPEAARRLSLSSRMIYKLASAGALRLIKIGRSSRVRAADVAAIAERGAAV
jgi:excisionase family DNA binding protein